MSDFSDLDRDGPSIPDYTCPAIDDAKTALAKLSEQLTEVCSDLDRWAGKYSDLEDLRKANDQLRDVGKYWRDAARDLCDEVAQKDAKISELESRISELEDELADAHRDIAA